jgi:glycerophosphoryl diester phosphodiesterase
MPAIVAHRGASADAPENTVASARLGWERAADAVEVDVHLTRDGKIAVIHDDTTKRTTSVDLRVRDHDLADLRALDAGSWKGAAWKGERIPTLEEILATVPPGKRLLVEVKSEREIIPELKRVLRVSTPPGARVTIIGFDLDTIVAAKKDLGLETYWLSGWKRDDETKEVLTKLDDLVRRAVRAGVDGLGLAHDGPIDGDAVRAIHDAGLRLNVWTVNDAEVARKLLRFGVDSITTDRPGGLREDLRSGDETSREDSSGAVGSKEG